MHKSDLYKMHTGLLPPFELFLQWLMETVQVYAFGGTPTTSTFRTVVHLAIAIAVAGVAHVIRDFQTLTLAFLAGAGFCLSLDVVGMAKETYQTLTGTVKHVSSGPSVSTTNGRQTKSRASSHSGIDSAYSSSRYQVLGTTSRQPLKYPLFSGVLGRMNNLILGKTQKEDTIG